MSERSDATRPSSLTYRIRCSDEPWWFSGEDGGSQAWTADKEAAAAYRTQRDARAAFDAVEAAYAPVDIGLIILGEAA